MIYEYPFLDINEANPMMLSIPSIDKPLIYHTYQRTYYSASLSFLYGILFKILSKREGVLYLKLLFQDGAAESDYPAVY